MYDFEFDSECMEMLGGVDLGNSCPEDERECLAQAVACLCKGIRPSARHFLEVRAALPVALVAQIIPAESRC